jgi:phosphoglycolate phosphatase
MSLPRPDMPFREWTFLFDLDGTLIDSAPDLLAALNHCLARADVAPVELADIRTMIGHGARAMIRKALEGSGRSAAEGLVDELWAVLIAYYQENIAVETRPFEGAENCLVRLAEGGARLGVCTNKTQALSETVLGALGLNGHFRAVVGADSVPRKKPDGDHLLRTLAAAGGHPARAIMIGDSRTDERAARSAGLPFVFVPFGYEAETREAIAADATISHYSELVTVLMDLTD